MKIIPKRKTIRIKQYNYSEAGTYFITICTENKRCIFGKIIYKNDIPHCHLSKWGEIAKEEWYKTAEIRKNVELDSFIVMPNHIHGIVMIRTNMSDISNMEKFGAPTRNSIPSIMRNYKSAVTKKIHELHLGQTVWQRNYYEHIIRTEENLEKIREYINNNPYNWQTDELYVPQ